MDKLECSSCHEIKTVDNFKLNKSRKRGYSVWCKECHKIYDKKRYEEQKYKITKQKKDRKILIREWFSDYKSSLKCEECGEDHPACFDFHHLDGDDKDACISDMVTGAYAIERIQKEIDKCIILCANCHRKLHYNIRNRDVG